ncbi:ribosome maturation factor RimM [Microlunatus parietis]|uniref:Ribosome maturation factor RimM n=1 Tax=Microlunatus parietis TaxID=682979 RepID=A0A7Y9ID72_9ACTN|nr:16S rRNA processing protein RimM [Microlunatus parietis]
MSVEVLVGVVGRAHGIRGDVAVEPRTDEPEVRFAAGRAVRIEGSPRWLTVVSARDHSGRLLVRFHEVEDRNAAEALRGVRLVVDVDPAERPDRPEEYYDRQLIGLRVLDAAGTEVGRVSGVAHLPAQDLLEIDTGDGQALVPFVTELVPDVDLDQGQLRLADVPGLLSAGEAETSDEDGD